MLRQQQALHGEAEVHLRLPLFRGLCHSDSGALQLHG